MNPQIAMKTRVNGLFLSLFFSLAVSPVIRILNGFFALLPLSEYTLEVFLPQLFYPLLLLAVSMGTLALLRIPKDEIFSAAPIRKDGFAWFGFFTGCVTAGNLLVNIFLDFLSRHGLEIPDPIGGDAPRTPMQAVGFFIVYAILPALCEEGIFRAGIAGSLKEFHPGAAILLSGIGFALFHMSLRQIPFAFGMGCLFAFLYVKTDHILYPVLFHFLNNTWACLITFLGVFAGAEWQVSVGTLGSLLSLPLGLVCGWYLFRKKKFSLKDRPRSLSGKQACSVVVTSPAFWGFVLVFSLLTAWNTLYV